MSYQIVDILEELRSSLGATHHSPAFVFGQHIVITIDHMIDMLEGFRPLMKKEDEATVMMFVDVATAAAVFFSLVKVNREKCIDRLMDGYNFAFATRFFDLSPVDLEDPTLQAKIAACNGLIASLKDTFAETEGQADQDSFKIVKAIISKLKDANQET